MNKVDVVVNQLGESIVEGTVVNILKKNGDFVNADDVILELETDKVTIEITAIATGVIDGMTCKNDDVLQVGHKIGTIDTAVKANNNSDSAVKNETASENSNNTAQFGPKNAPAAEKLMREKNLSDIQGTGPQGRTTKEDVLKNMTNNSKQSTATAKENLGANTAKSAGSREERVVKMSVLRKKIAQRLKDSQNTAAILTTFNEIDMTNVMAVRKKYKEIFEKKHGVKLGFMSFFVRAATMALQAIPEVNAEIKDDSIIYKNYCDVGVAVGTEKGLVVPVIRNAEKLELHEIEQTIVNYGKKARDGKLLPSDMTGGTFTISNGGVYGSLMSTPIINPPQAGILGMHTIQERPIVKNKEIKIAPMMYVALSYDHRIIDGKEAVTFLVQIKNYIEDPVRLLFGV